MNDESALASSRHLAARAALAIALLLGAGCSRPARADSQPAPSPSASPSVLAPSAARAPSAPPSPPKASAPPPPTRYLVLGDSHVFGYFGANLDEALRAPPGRQVWTYGSCGSSPMTWIRGMETPCGGFERPDGQPGRKLLSSYRTPTITSLLASVRPQHTIVVMGENFVRFAEDTAPHVRQFVDLLEKAGSSCVWVGPPEIPNRSAPDEVQVRNHKAIERLYRILRREAEPRCTLLDARAMGIRRWDTFDNIHVGPSAARQWSAEVARVIEARTAEGR